MTKEEKLLKGITKYLDWYAKVDIESYQTLSREEIAEVKAQKQMALEILVRFRLSDYAC